MGFGPLNYQRVPLLTSATANATTGVPVLCLGYTCLTAYVIGSGTTTTFSIVLEEADYNPAHEAADFYTGTWSAIATITEASVTGNAQYAYHVGGPGGTYAFAYVRARLSAAVVGGGNVSVVLVAV